MTDASKTRLFLTFQKSLVPSLIFFETVWKPYLFLKAHYKRWIRRRKFRQTAYSAHKSLTYSAPISLPSQRKRTLSILSTSEEPRPTIWTRILHPGTQHTNPQKQCFLLTKLPLELRHQIYQHILCSRVLHIIPSLVPSLTKPPHDSTNIETTLTRLDYEPCKWDEDTLIYGKANHSACAIWINGDGELYFRAPKAIVKGNKVETGFLRWWCRKGGMLNLLKTCRLIYAEAVPMLYTRNIFSFLSLSTFVQFEPTVLPSRLNMIRNLHLRFAIRKGDVANIAQACRILKGMSGLRQLTILIFDKGLYKKDNELLKMLFGVKVDGRFVVRVGWRETEWEKEMEGRWPFELVRDELLKF